MKFHGIPPYRALLLREKSFSDPREGTRASYTTLTNKSSKTTIFETFEHQICETLTLHQEVLFNPNFSNKFKVTQPVGIYSKTFQSIPKNLLSLKVSFVYLMITRLVCKYM